MVDALHDAHRVLVAAGTLLDLRPLAETRRLELVTPDGAVAAGEIDATSFEADDDAADAAMNKAVERRWFVHVSARQLVVRFRWDSVADLTAYIEGGQHPKSVRPSFRELEDRFRETGASRLEGMTTLRLGVYRRVN